MLKIESLNAHFGFAFVLQAVSLQAARCEVIGIFGRNGVAERRYQAENTCREASSRCWRWRASCWQSVVLVGKPTEGLARMIVTEVFAIIREKSAASSIVLVVE